MTLSQLLERWAGASAARRKTAREKRSFRPALEGLERRDLLSATMLADQNPLVNTSMSSYLWPPPPLPLTATAVSQTQINLSWNSVAGANGYVVDELEGMWGVWTQIGTVGSGGTSYSVTGLSPGTSYDFQVSATGTNATGWADATTAPVAPTFTVTVVSGTQVNLSVFMTAGASGYLIDESSNGAWTQLYNLPGFGGGVTITGLSPGTTYDFKVAAYNGGGTTWAQPQSATTFVAAPSFTLTPVSQTQINLSWGSVADASGYVIGEVVNGAFTQIGNVDSGSTSYSVNGLLPGITYYFDVAAYNAASATWAQPQSATTLPVDHPAAGGAYIPVSGSLFGFRGPSFLDVQQGAAGDCWLLASLAEVAARVPTDIRNMFTYDGAAVENGSVVGFYSVRLFDQRGVPHSILVDTELPESPNGGAMYDHPVNGVLWVALAEKAYAQANGAGLVTTGNIGSDSYSALSGGDPVWALQAITGLPANDFSINTLSIAAAWNAGELIVLGTNNPTSSYIVPSHAYAVVGYNPSSSLPFEVFNPWGTNSSGWTPGTLNGHPVFGLFLANAAFLSQNFSYQSIGVGAENGTNGHTKGLQAMTELIVAVDQLDALQSDQNLAGFGPLPRQQENLAHWHTR